MVRLGDCVLAAVLSLQHMTFVNGQQVCSKLPTSDCETTTTTDGPCQVVDTECVAVKTMECLDITSSNCIQNEKCELRAPPNRRKAKCMDKNITATFKCSMYEDSNFCFSDYSEVEGGPCKWVGSGCISMEKVACSKLYGFQCQLRDDCLYSTTPRGSIECVPSDSSYTCGAYRTSTLCEGNKSPLVTNGPCAWVDENCISIEESECTDLDRDSCGKKSGCRYGRLPNRQKGCFDPKNVYQACHEYPREGWCASNVHEVEDGPCVWTQEGRYRYCSPASTTSCDGRSTSTCENSVDCEYGRLPNGRKACYSKSSQAKWSCSDYRKSQWCWTDARSVADGPCYISSYSRKCASVHSARCEELNEERCENSRKCIFTTWPNQDKKMCVEKSIAAQWKCSNYKSNAACVADESGAADAPCVAIPNVYIPKCQSLAALLCGDATDENLCQQVDGCVWSTEYRSCFPSNTPIDYTEENPYGTADYTSYYSSEGSN